MIGEREAYRLLDSLTTGVLLFDAGGRLRGMNTAAEALLSLSARKAFGLPAAKVFPEAPPIASALQEALQRGQPYIEREVPLRSAAGETVTVDCVITPLLAGQETAEVVVELIDVDRMHRIARAERLKAEQDMTNALLWGLAHEVKNPLGGIRGAAQLLERELEGERYREYTRIIIGEVDRLRALIDRMLLPGTASCRVAVNIHEVLEHVRALVEAEVPGRRIARDYDPSLPELLADRDQLIQAFLNLLKNAVQAVQGGGEVALRTRAERQVTLNGRRHRLAVRVDVMDTGVGVPREMLDRIFCPMVSGRPEGTGLGLSITRSLVHRQGGMVACSSQPGRTVFSVWLPAGAHDQGQ